MDWLDWAMTAFFGVAGFFGVRFNNRVDKIEDDLTNLKTLPLLIENTMLKHEATNRQAFVNKQDYLDTINRVYLKLDQVVEKIDKIADTKEDKVQKLTN